MIEKVKQALQSILNRFEAGDIPEAITYSTFPIPNIPAAKWSLLIRGKNKPIFPARLAKDER